jgi:RHS repeat-associated protein
VGLGYDVQGNLNNKNGQAYDFGLDNRLYGVTGKESYRYDANGRRVLQYATNGSGNILSQYTRDGQLLVTADYRRDVTNRYIYLGGSLVAIRETPFGGSTSTIRYQHTDALGTPVAVTDESRAVVERSDYEPYGQLINRPLTDGPGFTGHVQDALTGLTYMQQRYYDPMIGRFLSTDPVTALSNPVGMFNRYDYAADNPYRFKDPDGRMMCGFSDLRCQKKRQDAERRGIPVLQTGATGGSSTRTPRPYDKNLKTLQQTYPQVTTELADAAYDRLSVDNPKSSGSVGKEMNWEIEPSAGGAFAVTPSRVGSSGTVGWSVIPGVTIALGHTHGAGDLPQYRYFSDDDVRAANAINGPVLMANPQGDFRIFVPGMKLNGRTPDGPLRGGSAAGFLLCQLCVPTGD